MASIIYIFRNIGFIYSSLFVPSWGSRMRICACLVGNDSVDKGVYGLFSPWGMQ